MIKVEYSLAEAQALTQIIDMAVRARGVEIAGNASALMKKLSDATVEAQARGDLKPAAADGKKRRRRAKGADENKPTNEG